MSTVRVVFWLRLVTLVGLCLPALNLAWRWFDDDRPMPEPRRRNRQPLRRDVYPGQAHAFWVSAPSPLEPRRYVLEIELVDEGRGTFAGLGTPPLRLPVTVAGERVALSIHGGQHIVEPMP